MKVLVVTHINESGRNAKTVDQFYYEHYDPLPYGARGLSRDMMKAGKVLSRTVCLNEAGDGLIIMAMFASEAAHQEYINHPTYAATIEHWKDRPWAVKITATPCRDVLEVNNA